MNFWFRWFTSHTLRHAVEFGQQVGKIRNAQRDELSAQALQAVDAALGNYQQSIRQQGAAKDRLIQAMNDLEAVANKWLRPYPNAGIREHLEMLLVVGAVVMACRTFFFQPMAIPSGSAQPTLWGITIQHLEESTPIPAGYQRFKESWILGRKYFHLVAEEGGAVHDMEDEKTVVPFVKRLSFFVGPQKLTVWFPPEEFYHRTGLYPGRTFRKGEVIVHARITSGDHLFVDRVSFNFRPPERGDIVIFESRDLPGLIHNTHYIKRLVALGDERVQIGDDRHLIINGRRLDASTPRFENVYSFQGPPRVDHYSGHVNDKMAAAAGLPGLAPLFPDADSVYTVPHEHYLAMGDNTLNSKDSRFWGPVPRDYVIGRCGFVFWPITDRFGWGVR